MSPGIVQVVQLAAKWGPRLMLTLESMDKLNKRFPDAPGKAAAYARGLGSKFTNERTKRSGAGRVRHTLRIVREATHSMEQDRADDLEFTNRAAAWRKRAADMENALALADARQGKSRRSLIGVIRTRADELAREVIEELGATVQAIGSEETKPGVD